MTASGDRTTQTAALEHLDDFLVPGGAWRSPLVADLLGPVQEMPTLEAGARVGPFSIVEAIGRGGMATVYRAERVDGDFAQRVALKVLPTRAGIDGETEALFRRERRILAGLEHPGIARLIDGGTSADGLQWLAMEFIDGERIDHWAQARRPPARDVVGHVRQAAVAVAHAHAQLAVHRDIKPSNVMVDARGAVRLLDFGIAALLGDERGIDPARGALTPRYASPEQRAGEPVGVAADVFQLGYLLTELLAIARGDEVDEAVPAPPQDRDLAAIIARATAPNPTDRYATVDAMLDDLERWTHGHAVRARGGGALYRLGRFVGRHRVTVAVVVLALTLLGAAATVSIQQIIEARRDAEREATKAREVSRFLAGVFNSASPYVSRGQVPTVADVLGSGVDRLQRELSDQPEVRGELAMVIGRVYVTLNQLDRARPLLAEAVDLGRSDDSLDPVQFAARLRMYGVTLQSAHRHDEALAAYTEARTLLEASRSEAAARELSGLMRNFVLLRYQAGDLAGAIRLQRETLARAIARLGENDLSVARARANLGQFINNYGDTTEGPALLREALAALRAQLGDKHPETIAIGGALGGVLIENGDLATGAPLLEASIAAGFESTPEQSPWYPLQLGYRAWLRMQQARYDEALVDATAALDIADRLPPTDDLNSVAVLETLGETHLRRGDTAAAIGVLQRMMERNREGRHSIRVDLGHRPLLLARAYAAAGDCVNARVWLERAEGLLVTRTLPGHALRHDAAKLAQACPATLS